VPLWKNIRRLSFSGPVQGVVNPGPADIILPIQAVQILDDAAHAVQPATVPRGFATATIAGGAADFAGLEISARAGGIWIVRVHTLTAVNLNLEVWRDETQATVVRSAALQTVGGVPNLASFASGIFDVRIAAIPAFAAPMNVQTPGGPGFHPLDLFVPPGERWFLVNDTVNVPGLFALSLREVPTTIRDLA